jgi:hypothetical protein
MKHGCSSELFMKFRNKSARRNASGPAESNLNPPVLYMILIVASFFKRSLSVQDFLSNCLYVILTPIKPSLYVILIPIKPSLYVILIRIKPSLYVIIIPIKPSLYVVLIRIKLSLYVILIRIKPCLYVILIPIKPSLYVILIRIKPSLYVILIPIKPSLCGILIRIKPSFYVILMRIKPSLYAILIPIKPSLYVILIRIKPSLYVILIHIKPSLITTQRKREHVNNSALKITILIFVVKGTSFWPSLGARAACHITYDEAIMGSHAPSVPVTSYVSNITIFPMLQIFVIHSLLSMMPSPPWWTTNCSAS